MGIGPAQALYHKYGFKAEGIRKNYYPDTKEDDNYHVEIFPMQRARPFDGAEKKK